MEPTLARFPSREFGLTLLRDKVRYDSHQTRNTDVMVRIQPLNAPIRIFTVTESAEAVIYDSKLS